MENNEDIIKNLFKQINKLIDYKLNKTTQIKSAIVQNINTNGTVDIVVPPDHTVYHNIQNQSIYQNLNVGDHVKIIKENNSLSNMWIIGGFGLQQKNIESIDYIVEQGTESMGGNDLWYWSKWQSGRAECYGIKNYGNISIDTAWGSLYKSSSFIQSFPKDLFTNVPVIHIDFHSSDYEAWVIKGVTTRPTATSTGNFIVVCPTSATLNQVYLSFYVIGRWK